MWDWVEGRGWRRKKESGGCGTGGREVERWRRKGEREKGRQPVSRSEVRDGGMDGKKRRLRKDKQTKVRMRVARLSPLIDSLVN